MVERHWTEVTGAAVLVMPRPVCLTAEVIWLPLTDAAAARGPSMSAELEVLGPGDQLINASFDVLDVVGGPCQLPYCIHSALVGRDSVTGPGASRVDGTARLTSGPAGA